MTSMRNILRWTVAATVGLAGSLLAADWWNPVSWFAPTPQETLIVSGNYVKPRLLAELAQRRSEQSVLLVSGEEIFLLTANGEAVAEQKGNLAVLVDHLKPKRIFVLGDNDYAPAGALEALRGKYPVLAIAGDDWRKNAQALEDAMRLHGLAEYYGTLLTKLESRMAAPAPAPAAVSEPVVAPAAAVAAPAAPAPAAAPVAPAPADKKP